MAFLAGIGWRLQRKFRVTSSQTHSNSVSDTPLSARALPSDSGMFDPDGKGWERPHRI